MEADQIIEIWDVFKEYIPEKNKETAASHYINFLIGQGTNTSDLRSVIGYDSHLDDAIELATGVEDEDEDEDDWDSYEDED